MRKGAYDPHAMITENEEDGVCGSCLQPSQGLFWYRGPDSELLTEVCRVYNDWITDFCKPYPERLKGITMSMSTMSRRLAPNSSAARNWG